MNLWILFLAWAARRWIRLCLHPSEQVTYDLREQAISDDEWPINYCNRCGAVRVHHKQSWRLPTP